MAMGRATEKWEAGESAEVVLRVHEAQIQQLYAQTWVCLAGIIGIMVAACIVLWQVVPQGKLLLWSGALVLLSSARAILVAAFQRKIPTGPAIYWWARMHVAGAVMSGALWAMPTLVLWPEHSPVHQMIWPICIVALAASAVAKYCTWKPVYLPYVLLTVVPLSLRLLAEGQFVYVVLGILGIVFTFVLAQTGEVMHNASLRALLMGIHNERLSRVLTAEKEKEEALNVQLQLEIAKRIQSQDELHRRNQELEQLNSQLIATKTTLETTNKELEQAVFDIRQLSGMLPICASCKKIRNDNGYWQQIESYIRAHADVEFSHGICPDCAAKLYPDFLYKE